MTISYVSHKKRVKRERRNKGSNVHGCVKEGVEKELGALATIYAKKVTSSVDSANKFNCKTICPQKLVRFPQVL